MFNALVILAGMALVLLSNRESLFFQLGGVEQVLCVALVAVCVLPMIRWTAKGMNGVPVFESFCLMHFPYYAHPILATRWQYLVFPSEIRIKSALLCLIFLTIAIAVFHFYTSTFRDHSGWISALLDRRIGDVEGSRFCWLLLGIWLITQIVFNFGLINLGGALNMVRAFSSLGGLLSIFNLYWRWGSRRLSPQHRATLTLIFGTGVVVQFASGFLVNGSMNILTALIAFAVGRRQVPVLAAVVAFAVITFLHIGKSQMRERFWDPESGQGTTLTVAKIKDIYSHWFTASLEQMLTQEREEGEEKKSAMDRAVLIQYLAHTVIEAPASIPFLNGKTYFQIPQLLIPRVFWPGKPRGSLPNETMAIHFGIQSEEAVDFTAVGMGMIAEAWGNFGWIGVIMAGAFFGVLLGILSNFAAFRAPDSIGYFLAAASINWTFNLEQAMGTYLISLSQSMFAATLVLWLATMTSRGGSTAAGTNLLNPWKPSENGSGE